MTAGVTGGVDKLIAQAKDALLDLGPYLVGTKESAAAYDDLSEAIAGLRLTLVAAEAREKQLREAMKLITKGLPFAPYSEARAIAVTALAAGGENPE